MRNTNSNISRIVKLLSDLVSRMLYITSIHLFTDTHLDMFYSKIRMAFVISENIHLGREELANSWNLNNWRIEMQASIKEIFWRILGREISQLDVYLKNSGMQMISANKVRLPRINLVSIAVVKSAKFKRDKIY